MITLNENENLVHIARKHWFPLVLKVTSTGFSALIALFFVFAAESLLSSEITSSIGQDKMLIISISLAATILLVALMLLAIEFTDYYLDAIVVTDKRVIDCDQQGLFSRDIATIPLENIVDIKITTVGIIQTFLRFGSIHIQTAGEIKEVVVKNVANPLEVKDRILGLYRSHTTAPQQIVQVENNNDNPRSELGL